MTADRSLLMPLLLTYHRVTPDPGNAPSPLGLEMDVETFKAQLDLLEREFSIVSPEQAFNRQPWDGVARPSVVLTFDDGTVDFHRTVAPILSERGIPALVCVTTEGADQGSVFWWDALYWIMRENIGSCLGYPATTARSVFFQSVEELDAAFPSLVEEGKRYDCHSLMSWINAELRFTPMSSEFIERNRSMTWVEIGELGEGIVIASHGLDHAILSTLDEREAHRQLAQSSQRIAEKLGKEPEVYVYPNGGPGDYSRRDTRLVAETGYSAALTVRRDVLGLSRSSKTADLVIPRVTVGGYADFVSRDILFDRAGRLPAPREFVVGGNRLIAAGQVEDGLACLRHAATLDDADGASAAELYLSRQYLQSGDIESARQAIERACELAPENRDVRLLHHSLALREKLADKAERRRPLVFLVSSAFSKGGGPMVALALARYFSRYADVELVCVSYDSWAAAGDRYPRHFIPDPEALLSFLADRGVDGVLIFNCISLWTLIHAMGVPLVEWTAHGACSPSGQGLCLNPDPPRRATSMADPIDVRAIADAPVKRFWDDGDFVLGLATRLSYIKNLEFLLEGVARLQRRGRPEVRLLLLGADTPVADGGGCHTREALRALATSKLLDGSFAIFEPEEVIPYIKGIDLAVCTSHSEGMPLFLLEAAAAGIPFVASDVGYIGHYGGDGECGVVYPPKDMDAFVREVESLMDDRERLFTLGRNALARVVRDNSLDVVGNEYLKRLKRQGFTTDG